MRIHPRPLLLGLAGLILLLAAFWQTRDQAVAALAIAALGAGLLGGAIAQYRRLSATALALPFRLMVECAGDGIAILRNGRLVFANPALGALLGYEREQLLGQPFERHAAPRQQERVAELLLRCLPGDGLPQRYEAELRHAGGCRIPVQLHSCIEHHGGQALQIVFIRDIREQRAAAEQIRALNEYMDSIIDNADIWLNTLDKEGRIVIWNKAAERISGYRRDEVVGRTEIWNWLYPDEAYRNRIFSRAMDILIRDTVASDLETTIRTKDSRRIVLSWNSRMLTNAAGETVGSIAVARDVTLERRAQEALQLHASVFETAEPLAITNPEGVFLRVNRAFTRMFGHTTEEITGRTLLELQPDSSAECFPGRLWQELAANGHWSGELWERRKDGTPIPVRLTMSTVRDGQGTITHYVAHWQDISERKTFEAQIQRQALHDPLTGLPNRRLANSRLEQEMGRALRLAGFGALLFLDLDGFKQINDSLGHASGDTLLATIAQRLQKILRIEDMAARIGGDEFIVLLGSEPGSQEKARARARRVGDKVLAAIAKPITVDECELSVSASVGIALYPDADMNAAVLLQRADRAMYQAKENGRGSIHYFAEAGGAKARHRQRHFSQSQPSTEDEQLQLSFQPINDRRGKLAAVEALVCWQPPKRGLCLPSQYILVVEKTGLAAAVDCWILSTACRKLAAWQSAGLLPNRLRMTVNISPRLLTLADFPGRLQRILQDTGAQPQNLVLEIAEAALCNDTPRLAAAMQATRQWGIGFSVDAFGGGHTAAGQLEHLPIDSIKIAPSLVARIPQNEAAAIVVEAAQCIAKRLGAGMAAEGIDTQEQLDSLRAHGCRLFQGKCIGAALNEDKLTALLRDSQPRLVDQGH